MLLRKPELAELPELSALIMRSKAVHGYDDAFMEMCRDELTLTPEKLDAGPAMLADIDSKLAGVAQLMRYDAGEWHLQLLFVEPDYFGRGVGARLMAWAAQEARRLGAAELYIEADPDAETFYLRMGAERRGEAASQSIPGRFLPLLVLPLGDSSKGKTA